MHFAVFLILSTFFHSNADAAIKVEKIYCTLSKIDRNFPTDSAHYRKEIKHWDIAIKQSEPVQKAIEESPLEGLKIWIEAIPSEANANLGIILEKNIYAAFSISRTSPAPHVNLVQLSTPEKIDFAIECAEFPISENLRQK